MRSAHGNRDRSTDDSRLDPTRAVLEDEALLDREAKLARGEEERVGEGLAALEAGVVRRDGDLRTLDTCTQERSVAVCTQRG